MGVPRQKRAKDEKKKLGGELGEELEGEPRQEKLILLWPSWAANKQIIFFL